VRRLMLLGCLGACAFAQDRALPRHVFGSAGPLTPPLTQPAREISRGFLSALNPTFEKAGMYVAREYTDVHNGVTHVHYRQQFRGLEVYNSAYVVNVDREGRVLNAGGDLYPAPSLPPPDPLSALTAVRAAVRAVNPAIPRDSQPFLSRRTGARAGSVRFSFGALPDDVEGRAVWFGLRGQLLPAWAFVVPDAATGAIGAVIVDAISSEVLGRTALTFFQNPPRGLVFDREGPQPNPQPGTLVTQPPPIAERTLQSFEGDPMASPLGWTATGETSGNNAIVGQNLLGVIPFPAVAATKASNGDFSFPLQLGPGAPNPLQFADAVNTNLFFWVNRAHDLFYRAGFSEAAGNFQNENLGRGGIGGDRILAFSHFGAQAVSSARRMNAFFTTPDVIDGTPAYIAMFIGDGGAGSFFTDGSLDSGVIVHEYAHGVSLRLLPRGYDSYHLSAMGEGWSDYFGLEFTTAEGAPPEGVFGVGEYFFQTWSQTIRTRPYTTDLAANPLTFAELGRVRPYAQVHADGEIWCLVLWEARANLIRQFGDREGRRRINTIILDGMKLAPPQASFIDMRDAILLADRVTFNGESQSQLWDAFAKRGMGAVAYSGNPDITYVVPSYERPSERGKIAFSTRTAVIGEPVQVIVEDSNNHEKAVRVWLTASSGDLESLQLRRSGSVYTGAVLTSGGATTAQNGRLELMTGDYISVYYDDASAESGEFEQIQATIPTQNPYVSSSSQTPFEFPDERQIFPSDSGVRVDLPWEFPFYDRKYRSLYVHEDGLITFGSTYRLNSLGPCTDRATLQAITAIAPLFLNITTRGNAQAKEGVFVSRTIDQSVTVRWAGETDPPFGGSMPASAANFAATLYSDGRIEFRYGKGNTELSSTSMPLSCGPGPVAGLSPGRDSYVAQTFPASFTERTTVRWDPPFGMSSIPFAAIETPRPGDTLQDVLTVSGVAYDSASPLTRVEVLVDGVRRASSSVNQQRPDFCANENVPGCPKIGWSAVINTSALQPGDHRLQVRVSNSRGGFADYPQPALVFHVAPGKSHIPFGKLESPTAGAVVSGALTVRGYVAAPGIRVLSVDTLIDGVSYGPTSYGIRRDDICNSLDPRPSNCPGVGFQLLLNPRSALPPIADGAHSIQMRIRDEAGRYTLVPEEAVPFRVENGARLHVAGAVTSVRPGETVKGTIQISGYAYVPGGGIRSATLYVDDVLNYGTMVYGLPREDICAALNGIAACPNIGFSTTFDTTRLSNGPHTFSVVLSTNTGESFRLPLYGTPVLSIVVEN
jgi:hypothetical protein